MKPSSWSVFFAILRKDILTELRNRDTISGMIIFSFMVIVIFNFALELQPNVQKTLIAGILWVTIAFSGSLGMNRIVAAEKDKNCLDGLMLAPIDRSIIYLAKAVSTLLFIFCIELIIIPLSSLFFSVNLFQPGVFLVCVLGSIGYAFIGTFLANMAIQTRSRDIMLPILLFPLALPVLIASVKATSGFLLGDKFLELVPWLNILFIYDVIVIAFSFVTYDFLLAE